MNVLKAKRQWLTMSFRVELKVMTQTGARKCGNYGRDSRERPANQMFFGIWGQRRSWTLASLVYSKILVSGSNPVWPHQFGKHSSRI